jgi:large subunit ribosomal protein L21
VYAVVRTGGKQYRVQEGRTITVERLPGEAGDSIELGDVLLLDDGSNVTVGAPTVAGARVLGTIAEQGRAKKIIVFRYKAKTRARKKNGHRQQFTRLTVEDILAPGQEPKPKAAAPAATEAAAPEAEAAPKGRRSRKKAAEPVAEAAAEAPPTEAEAPAEPPAELEDTE